MKMIEVVAAIIERDGKILLAQRPAQSDQAGLWEFAGGKLWVNMLPAISEKFRGGLSIFMPGTYPTSTGRYRHMNIRRWSGAHLKRRCNIRWPLLTFHY